MLKPFNQPFNTALKAAMAAVFSLDAHGVCIHRIDVNARRPVITIEPPPAGAWLRGALKSRITVNNVTRTVMAAPFRGCQLEWEVTENRCREVANA